MFKYVDVLACYNKGGNIGVHSVDMSIFDQDLQYDYDAKSSSALGLTVSRSLNKNTFATRIVMTPFIFVSYKDKLYPAYITSNGVSVITSGLSASSLKNIALVLTSVIIDANENILDLNFDGCLRNYSLRDNTKPLLVMPTYVAKELDFFSCVLVYNLANKKMLALDLSNPDSLQSLIRVAPQTLNVILRGTTPVITLSDGVYDIADFLRHTNNSDEDMALWFLTHPELQEGSLVFTEKEENAVITLPNVPVNAVKLPSQVGYQSLKIFMPAGDTGIIVSTGSHKKVHVYGDMLCTKAAFVRDIKTIQEDTSLDLTVDCLFDKLSMTNMGANSRLTTKSVRSIEVQGMLGVALDISNAHKLVTQKAVLRDSKIRGLTGLVNGCSYTKIYDSEFSSIPFLDFTNCVLSNVKLKNMPRVFLRSADAENVTIEGDTMTFVGVYMRKELITSNLPLVASKKGYYTHEFKFLSPMSDGTYTLGINFSLAAMNIPAPTIRLVAKMNGIAETLIDDVLDKDTAANFHPNTYFNRSITLDFTSLPDSQNDITVRVPIQVSPAEMDMFEPVVALYSWEIIAAKTLLPFRFKTNGAKVNLMVYPVFGTDSFFKASDIYKAKSRSLKSSDDISAWTKALPFPNKRKNGALISKYTRNVFNCLNERGMGAIETYDFYYLADYIHSRYGGYYAGI